MKDNREIAYKLYQEGRAAMKGGDFEVAIEKLKQSADLGPHFKTYESLGECFLELKDLTQAIKYAAAAAGLGNNQFRARFILAKGLLAIGKTVWAQDKLKEALQMKPDYKAARELLTEIMREEI